MKHFLCIAATLFLSFLSFSQETDTTVRLINSADSTFTLPDPPVIEFFNDCAHGHICCYADCLCCPELNREQVYDTVLRTETNGILRAVISERYVVARSHDSQPTHIRFKKNGVWSEKFYPVYKMNQEFMFYTEYLGLDPKKKEPQPYEKEEVLVFDTNGEFMVLDPEGKEVPMKFEVKTVLSPELTIGSTVISNQVICALLNPEGTAISRTKYIYVHPFNEDGFAVVQSTRGMGLIDKYGKEVIPSNNYALTRIGTNRYAAGRSTSNSHIYNEKGEQLTKEYFEDINPYSEGLALARTKKGKNCFLDMNGEIALKIEQHWSQGFSDGMAAVLEDDKWGFIDRTGKLVIPCQYYNVHEFHNGVAPVATGGMNDEKWILIDKTGKQVNNKSYSEIRPFKSGIAQMGINGLGYGFIDTKGKEVMECTYTDLGYGTPTHWDLDGKFVRSTIKDRNIVEGSMEIVDMNGKQLAKLEEYVAYQTLVREGRTELGIYPFFLAYKKDLGYNLVNFEGKTLFKRDYDNIMVYGDQLAIGVKAEHYFILNPTTGELISNFGTKRIQNIQYGIVTVIVNAESYLYDYYDLNGKKIEE